MKTRTQDDERRIDEALARLFVAWRQGLDVPTRKAYADVFDGLTVDEIERGCWDAMRARDTEFMPAAAVIRQGILQDRQRRRFSPQWERPEYDSEHLPVSREEAAHWLEVIKQKLGRSVVVGRRMPEGGRR